MTEAVVLLGAGLLAYVLWPLGETAAAASARGDAEAARDAALTEILDLDADLAAGKISKVDHAAARAEAERRAAAAIRALAAATRRAEARA